MSKANELEQLFKRQEDVKTAADRHANTLCKWKEMSPTSMMTSLGRPVEQSLRKSRFTYSEYHLIVFKEDGFESRSNCHCFVGREKKECYD